MASVTLFHDENELERDILFLKRPRFALTRRGNCVGDFSRVATFHLVFLDLGIRPGSLHTIRVFSLQRSENLDRSVVAIREINPGNEHVCKPYDLIFAIGVSSLARRRNRNKARRTRKKACTQEIRFALRELGAIGGPHARADRCGFMWHDARSTSTPRD